ncbi:uracil-DNA glycosylase family protein [Prevotella intermedia]|uniref:uracil-DNA glycosylase family protein n=1 Tax=Prevotella intermedia TaxID=28131 RepID=UPI000BE70DAE|nr:uracil-DNA glycosylase family protein [Prevotella intermedia]PDP81159.1 DNA glycosylase [Prevotella intermedia]
MELETHPFEPWLPTNAKLLMLGTFPPAPKRWAMEWYYPNFTNDMWRIFGLVFFGDKLHFVDEANKTYRLNELKQFLKEKGVALFDTALRIRRTTGTASDKDLEIVQPADLDGMLRSLPECKAVLAAGQLATKVFTEHYNIDARNLKMGEYRTFDFEGRTLKLYRQPSSSRAYPMKVEKKAVYYEQMFKEIQII